MTRVLPLFVLLAAHPASAQPSSTNPSCARVQNIQFPADDRPNEVQKARLKGCDSEDLYYGIEGPADPVKARLCAYQQMDSREELVFGGEAILMMVYAIGAGASRNLDLAIKLACAIEGAPAELDGRLRHLEALKDQRSGRVTFDLCDDITSGFMMGYCAAHDQRLARAERQRRWKSHFDGCPRPHEKPSVNCARWPTRSFTQGRVARSTSRGRRAPRS